MANQISEREIDILHDIRDMELPADMENAIGPFMARFLDEITVRGRAEGHPVPDMNELFKRKLHDVEFMFPHFFTVPNFSAMSSYRIRSLTPETCFFELWSLDYIKDGEQETPKTPTIITYESDDFPEIPRQDYANLPLQQIGLHADGFRSMKLLHRSEGLISNYNRLIDGYLAGLDPAILTSAPWVVNQGYDAPIADIGF